MMTLWLNAICSRLVKRMNKAIRYVLLLLVFGACAMGVLNTYMMMQLRKELESVSNYLHAEDDLFKKARQEIDDRRVY